MPFEIRDRNTNTLIAAASEDEDAVRLLEGCWYFRPELVDMSHLVITDRTYTCPYKGVCYWIDLESPTTQVRNIAFVYSQPKPGYEYIKDRIAFYGRDTSGTLAIQTDTEQAPA